MARFGLFIDTTRCIGCYGCVVGCKNWHKIEAVKESRIRLMDITTGEYPNAARWLFPVACMHCEHPPCASVCRYEATHKREDGIVVIDTEKCVGCELCILACPYGARYLNKELSVADACDLCADRLDSGLRPFCIETCPTDALVFGDLDDPESTVRALVSAEKAEPLMRKYGTKPQVYYPMTIIDIILPNDLRL